MDNENATVDVPVENPVEDEVNEETDATGCQVDEPAQGDDGASELSHNQEIGRRGEVAAARYLEKIGFEILDRNWRCPAGEADIIARDESALVFCEVKTRTSLEAGFPAEAVTPEKRARYEKIAGWYLRDYEYVDIPVRFDVLSLLVVSKDRALIKHYFNAFGEGGC